MEAYWLKVLGNKHRHIDAGLGSRLKRRWLPEKLKVLHRLENETSRCQSAKRRLATKKGSILASRWPNPVPRMKTTA